MQETEIRMWRERAQHYRELAKDDSLTEVSRGLLFSLGQEAEDIAQEAEDRLKPR